MLARGLWVGSVFQGARFLGARGLVATPLQSEEKRRKSKNSLTGRLRYSRTDGNEVECK